mmetsp:Transcript_52299/g.136176  ORF Transcript_52299/g.136176 Transcript_52299/m.136176 type:complete len:204 (+) Transcript_52299:109-720(+)
MKRRSRLFLAVHHAFGALKMPAKIAPQSTQLYPLHSSCQRHTWRMPAIASREPRSSCPGYLDSASQRYSMCSSSRSTARSPTMFWPWPMRRVFSMHESSAQRTHPLQCSRRSSRTCIVYRFRARTGLTSALQVPQRNKFATPLEPQASSSGASSFDHGVTVLQEAQSTPGNIARPSGKVPLENSLHRVLRSNSALTSALAAWT